MNFYQTLIGAGLLSIIANAGLAETNTTTNSSNADTTSSAITKSNPSVAELIKQAQLELQAGNNTAAYDLLFAQELNYAGDIDFDYWFGVAAVRAGKPARAIFALERVTATNPNHAGARLELATAYHQVGQLDAARSEVARLETLAPPPSAGRRLDNLRQAINYRSSKEKQPNHLGYIKLEAGHDNNVGTWPQDDRFFFGAPIEPVDSGYQNIQAGYWYEHSLNSKHKIGAWVDAGSRTNGKNDEVNEATQFDQETLSARAEWKNDLNGRDNFALGTDITGIRLDNDSYLETQSVYTQLQRKSSNKTNLLARLRVRNADFEEPSYDYIQSRLTLGAAKKINSQLTLNAYLFGAYNKGVHQRVGGDNTDSNLAFDAVYLLSPRQRLGLTLAAGYSDYKKDYLPGQAVNNTEKEARTDSTYSSALYYDWFLEKNISLTFRTDYREQQSTLSAYDYDKTTGSIALNIYF